MKELMIDTVVLKLDNAQKHIKQPALFNMSEKYLSLMASVTGATKYRKFVQNRSLKHGYYPRLTVIYRWDVRKRTYTLGLKIEFSVPKLLFDNNIDELSDSDFELVLSTLQSKLDEMGVVVTKADLCSLVVDVVHFSKNIPLSGRNTAYGAMQRLSKLDIPRTFDLNHRHFQNDGHSLYFDNGSNQVVFYDKIRDIKKSKRQSIDSEKTTYQLNLFDKLSKDKVPLELLRFEIRLTKKHKLNAILKQNGFNTNPSFEDIFSTNMAKTIVLSYWKALTREKNLFLIRNTPDALNMLLEFYSDKEKPSCIELLGIAYIIGHSEKYGVRDLKHTLAGLYSTRTIQRMNKYFDQINEIASEYSVSDVFSDIQNCLNYFGVVKVKDLEVSYDL